MRAFLLLLNTLALVTARLPYIKSSGYYSPFPPKNNQIMYEFAPLSPSPHHDEDTKTRNTRDLAWREFDAFISGSEEPSCADLRRMWRLAKQLQQKAIESNEISQEMHHHPFQASFKVPEKSPESSQSNQALRRTKFSSTSEVEVPLEQSSEKSLTKQSRDRPSEDRNVYGIVKTHAPAQAPQVRDPTKEILRGLWGSERSGGSRRPQFQYGRIQTHVQQPADPITKSPFQQLQTELFGSRSGSDDNTKENSEAKFGTVHRFSPKTSNSEVSRLDRVRSILNQESDGSDSSQNAFDRIREKLLNTRVRERFRTSRERNLRKKGSKKRRRNAEEVALIKERLLKNYIKMLPNYARSIDAAKKRRRRRKNKTKSSNNHKKWRISRDKIREQNLLLKKLGK